MDILKDISTSSYKRLFVIGEIRGDLDRLMTLLYEQFFNFEDILIATGNIIDLENPRKSIEVLNFFARNKNCYSVRGQQEADYLRYANDPQLSHKLLESLKQGITGESHQFVFDLPLIIKLSSYYYVVHAGVEPNKSVDQQDPECYFSIGEYNPESRFYQFPNPNQTSWYNFGVFDSRGQVNVLFSSLYLDGKIKVPSGYCLGRKENIHDTLKCWVLPKSGENPIIIES